jgi:hypothetical protein
LRKIIEDHAEQNAHLFFEFNREKILLTRTIKELKEKSISENESWTRKIDELRSIHAA